MTAALLEAPPVASAAPSKVAEAPALAPGPVVCACDFSPATAGALAAASALARLFGAELLAVHVVPQRMPASRSFGPLPNLALLRPTLREDVGRALDGALQPARAASLSTRAELRAGQPAEEILSLAAAVSAGLLVVGTHARRAIDRAMLGSVAEKVLRTAAAPVLAVPPAFAPRPDWPRSILWATDFSPDAAAALPYASAIAGRARAGLVALHVAPRASAPGAGARAVDRLRHAAGGDAPGARLASPLVVTGSPAAAILDVARDMHAGLVVLGASGTGALGRMVFGSTVLRVVREAACPVLVVRRP